MSKSTNNMNYEQAGGDVKKRTLDQPRLTLNRGIEPHTRNRCDPYFTLIGLSGNIITALSMLSGANKMA